MIWQGTGSVMLRIDHELVGRTLAEKLRRKAESRGEGDSFWPAEHKCRKVVPMRAGRGLR